MNNQQPQQHGRGTSWLISFGDLLTLLVCFFLSILSFSTAKKSANTPKAPELLSSEAVLHSQSDPIQNANPSGTQIADKKVAQEIGSDLSQPLRIDFELAEFEG